MPLESPRPPVLPAPQVVVATPIAVPTPIPVPAQIVTATVAPTALASGVPTAMVPGVPAPVVRQPRDPNAPPRTRRNDPPPAPPKNPYLRKAKTNRYVDTSAEIVDASLPQALKPPPEPPRKYWCLEHQCTCLFGDRKHRRCFVTPNLPGAMRLGAVASDSAGAAAKEPTRHKTGIPGFDRVVGGGLAEESIVLIAGGPGCGKSRLLAWVCANLADRGATVLYASAEETVDQIKLRLKDGNMFRSKVFLKSSHSMEDIEAEVKKLRPHIVVYDSISCMTTIMGGGAKEGSVMQTRAVGERIRFISKNSKFKCISIVICQINKDGDTAGPKSLEHLVDVILDFTKNERNQRELTTDKNRFGASGTTVIFEFHGSVMREVANATDAIMPATGGGVGSVLVPAMINGRCQVLPVDASFSDPRQGEEHAARPPTAQGITDGQLRSALDLLADHMDLVTKNRSVRLKVRRMGTEADLKDPAVDAALIVALASAAENLSLPAHVAVIGELSPNGRVENDPIAGERLEKAKSSNVKIVIGPMGVAVPAGIEYHVVTNVEGLLAWVRTNGVPGPIRHFVGADGSHDLSRAPKSKAEVATAPAPWSVEEAASASEPLAPWESDFTPNESESSK